MKCSDIVTEKREYRFNSNESLSFIRRFSENIDIQTICKINKKVWLEQKTTNIIIYFSLLSVFSSSSSGSTGTTITIIKKLFFLA